MYKDIVLLACSNKHRNYCVAGIDVHDGKWVRVISEDENISEAVKEDDMRYEDGTLPQLLDIIRVPIVKHKPNYYQPENYLFDINKYWIKIGQTDTANVQKYATIKPEYLFYNTEKSVESEYIGQLDEKNKYSLIAVIPDNLMVQVKQWPEGKKVDMSFNYNGRWYRYLKVTDPEFLEEYLEYPEGNHYLGYNVLLVVSLGENYYNAHYKLISGVIRF